MPSFPQAPGGGARSEVQSGGMSSSESWRNTLRVSVVPEPPGWILKSARGQLQPQLQRLQGWRKGALGCWGPVFVGLEVPEVAGLLQVPLQSPAPDRPSLASDPLTHTASVRVTFNPRPFRELLLPLWCRNIEPGMVLQTRATLTPGLYWIYRSPQSLAHPGDPGHCLPECGGCPGAWSSWWVLAAGRSSTVSVHHRFLRQTFMFSVRCLPNLYWYECPLPVMWVAPQDFCWFPGLGVKLLLVSCSWLYRDSPGAF